MSKKNEYLLVDAYNIIFCWKNLKKIAEYSLEDARKKLLDTLCDYQGFKKINVIAVFDAHKVKSGTGSIEKYNNIWLVYTKEAETADNYIERATSNLAKTNRVLVATSDTLEQVIILGRGAYRISAEDFQLEIQATKKLMHDSFIANKPIKNNMLIDNLDEKTAKLLEEMRFQK